MAPPLVQVKQVPASTGSASPTYINYRIDSVFLKASAVINSIYPFNASNIVKVSVLTLSNTVNQYNITLSFNLASNKYLQFLANYNSSANTVSFSNFTYTPQTTLPSTLFQSFPLASLSQNNVIMSLVSSIFMTYPQYFSSAVSSIQQVLIFPPYFNITYNNSVFGVMRFDCEYNYLTNSPTVLNYIITPNSNSSNASTTASTQVSTAPDKANTNNSSPSSSDLFCVKYSNGTCTECAFRYYYDQAKQKCTAVQDWCYTFDYSSCVCTACFSGYVLLSGLCQLP
jgi:hypothetical protein